MFFYSLTLLDPFAGKVSRSYELSSIDFASARIVANAVLAAYNNWTDLAVVEERLTEVLEVVSAAGANSNIDRGATMQFDLGAGKTASINFPSPLVSTINTDRSVDLANAVVLAFTTLFTSGDVLISDGEVALSTIKGTLDK